MANRDWTGNKKSTFATLGASSHSGGEREQHDYYATEPGAVIPLMGLIGEDLKSRLTWEPACGEGHLSKALEKQGVTVSSSDLIPRGYGFGGLDFLKAEGTKDCNIVTNPPYKYAQEFVEKSLSVVPKGAVVAMFLKVTFLEGIKRRALFDNTPPAIVAVFSKRKKCAKNGDFEGTGSSAACYAWFIWRKGEYSKTEVRWI